MDQAAKRTDKRTVLWLLLLLGLGCGLALQSYILGNETLVFGDIGSDTKEQYIMQYNSIVNHLRAGDLSLWDFTNGLGADMFILNLFAPFLMAVYLLGVLFGPEYLTLYMVYVMAAEILLAGLACYFYLSEFPLEEKYKLPACLMYGFNGYLIIWGQHYQLGGVTVFLPLLLMFIEKTFRTKKAYFGVALISAVLLLNGFYQGYMCMLGGGIYVFFRVFFFSEEPLRERGKRFLALAGAMVLGLLMGAVNLLPAAAAQVLETSRLDSKRTLLERILGALRPWSRDYYKTLLYRLFGSNLQGKGNSFRGYGNYYEAANLFFSTLFILLLAQYVLTIHWQGCGKRKKAGQYLAVLLCAFLVAVPLGSLIFNGFAYAFSRHTFLLMPLFALMSAATLQRILKERRLSLPGLVLAALGLAAVYARSYRLLDPPEMKFTVLLLCLTGLLMAATLFCAVRGKGADQRLCYLLLMALLFVNIQTDTVCDFLDRDTLKKNDVSYYAGTYEDGTTEALAWIASQDDSFYRVEKDYRQASGQLDSMAQDYMGVSTYNSTRSKSTAAFVEKLWPQLITGGDTNHYRFSNTLREHVMADLTGVKYLLSRSGELGLSGYELIHQVGEVYIYRNQGTDSIGKFFTGTITRAQYEQEKDTLSTWSLLRELLIVEEGEQLSGEELAPYQKQEIDAWQREETALEDCTVTENGVETDGDRITLCLDTEALSGYEDVAVGFTLKVSSGAEILVSMDGQYASERYLGGKRAYSFAVPSGTKSITIEIQGGGVHTSLTGLTFTGVSEKSAFEDQSQIQIDAPEKDGVLTGTIRAGQDGTVMLAIPCDAGWSVYLDGEEQEIITGDYGFIAFDVKAGEYELTAKYQAPLFEEGAGISLVSLAVFVVLWILQAVLQGRAGKGKTNDRL